MRNIPGKPIDELELRKSKPVPSPVVADDASGYHADNRRLLDETEKQLYQRSAAKLNYLAHDLLDLRCATSCLSYVSSRSGRHGWKSRRQSHHVLQSAASAPNLGDLQAAKRVGRYLRRSLWQGWDSPSGIPDLECSCVTRTAVGLGTASTRSLGIQCELEHFELCTVLVATGSQSVIAHARRRVHSVASKHVGLRGLWLQGAVAEMGAHRDEPRRRVYQCIAWRRDPRVVPTHPRVLVSH